MDVNPKSFSDCLILLRTVVPLQLGPVCVITQIVSVFWGEEIF